MSSDPPRARTVLVTGAGRNLGAGIAAAFASEGHRVALVARTTADVEARAEELRAAGCTALAVPGDLSCEQEVARIAEVVTDELGTVEVLVNNAVSRLRRDFVDTTTAEFAAVFDVALWGTIWMTQAALPGMLAAGWGRVVTMIGSSVSRGNPHRTAIGMAKSAQAGLTRSLALEVAGSGVTVNGVAPGLIRTDRGGWTSGGDVEASLRRYRERAERQAMGRMGEIEEVAAACRFLASEGASYVNGHVIDVNGGDFR